MRCKTISGPTQSKGATDETAPPDEIVFKLCLCSGNSLGAIETIGSTKAGDVIKFDFLPGRGTTLTVNGATKGDAIAGADFYNAVLKVFMGQRPVDDRLKAGLLGSQPRHESGLPRR